jgi:Bacterial archaeo-eukaryotic release factor family 11
MLYVDLPTRGDIQRLGAVRAGACVSIYLPTTPLTQDAQADRIALKNLAAQALDALRSRGTDKAQAAAIEEALADLVDDDEFWRFQARSLAVLATPAETLTFRLPNTLQPLAMAADRFFIKPLLRAITVPQSAYVLALAQGAVRLVEVSGDLPSVTVKVEGLPSDVASAVGKASIQDRSQKGRIHGAEGQKVRMRQYARLVDQALRGLLAGSETPLILAAAQPLDAIFRSVCSYPHLVGASIEGNPEQSTDEDLGRASRAILDQLHRDELAALNTLFETRSAQGRTTTDIAQAAKAATFGAVATLLVDIDDVVPGHIDDDGRVNFDAAGQTSHGVVDQIAARALASGARVLGLRRADIPGGGSLAAILRYAF